MNNPKPAPGRLLRFSTAAVVIGIGAVAAVISYRHAYDLAVTHGETGQTARLLPLTIDGLVYVASMVMLDSARRGHQAPALAKWALALGIGATVAANVAHGVAHGPLGAAIAAWPAVALVVTVELAMGMIRRSRAAVADEVPDAPAVESAAPAPESTAPEVDPVLSDARDRFADVLSLGAVPSVRAIKRELRVGHPRAVRIHAALADA